MNGNDARKRRRVFLAYAQRDHQFATALSEALNSEGAEIADPIADGRHGGLWADKALEALKRADFLVFVVPRFEGEGVQALAELGAARALGKTIVPVVPEPGWYADGAIASVVSRYPALDASRLPKEELARTILARGVTEAQVA